MSRNVERAWVPTLYFAEGIPYAAVTMIATVLYTDMGIDNTTMTFFTSWLYLPWVLKAIWSPVVEIFGTRRQWILCMQFAIAISFAAIALVLPGSNFFRWSLIVFWGLAFLSATHDISADGFYILGLTPHSQSLWVGLRTTFYRLALLFGQGGVVYAAGIFEHRMSAPYAWQMVFVILSGLFFLLGVWHMLVLPRPSADISAPPVESLREAYKKFVVTFADFFRKKHVVAAILFMLLYKLPEALIIKMIAPFLLDSPEAGGLGMTTANLGITYGTLGAAGLMAGGIVGGFVAARRGLRFWLFPMAWSMSLTCVVFVVLSVVSSPALWIIDICVIVEQFGYGFGCTAYTLYLLYFSQGRYSTSHYAICTGFMALGMMLPGMVAGKLQTELGYPVFFIIATACCLVTILSCRLVTVPANFGRKL